MSAFAHRVHYRFEEYLSLEATSPIKHEYWDGNIYAMAGGSPDHAALATMASALLVQQLRASPCRVFGADLRVRIPHTGLDTYPDVAVVCGPRQIDAEDKHAINNPTLLVEVLSDSTEAYDRGDKFEHYKRLPSLRQYVLIAQSARQVEVWSRVDGDVWRVRVHGDAEVADLGSIRAQLNVHELYEAAAEPLG